MSKKLVLIGASGHGKVIADIAKNIGYSEIVFLDDNEATTACGKYSVVGKSESAGNYSDCDFVVSIGNVAVRKRIQEALEKENLNVVALIHPHAVVADDVSVGKGSVIMAGAVVNSGASIGKGCIINTCASVDHDCCIENYVHVSVGAHIAGTSNVGESTWIGAGATVINNISICSDCMIGAGAVVVRDIVSKGTYKGVPARSK